MNQPVTYERYPLGIVLASNGVSLAILAIGTYVLIRILPWLAAPYLAYALWIEVRLLSSACVDCAYYGKACAFGRGVVSRWFFRKGQPERFACREIAWTVILPDMLVWLIPLAAGAVFLVWTGWDLVLAVLLIALLGLSTFGTGLVRGTLACDHCQQRILGCPAHDLFQGGRNE